MPGDLASALGHVSLHERPQTIELRLMIELNRDHHAVRHAFGPHVVVIGVFDVGLVGARPIVKNGALTRRAEERGPSGRDLGVAVRLSMAGDAHETDWRTPRAACSPSRRSSSRRLDPRRLSLWRRRLGCRRIPRWCRPQTSDQLPHLHPRCRSFLRGPRFPDWPRPAIPPVAPGPLAPPPVEFPPLADAPPTDDFPPLADSPPRADFPPLAGSPLSVAGDAHAARATPASEHRDRQIDFKERREGQIIIENSRAHEWRIALGAPNDHCNISGLRFSQSPIATWCVGGRRTKQRYRFSGTLQ